MQCSSLLVTHPHDLHEYLPHTFVSLDSFPLKLHYSNSIFPRTLTKWNSLDSSLKPFPPVKEAEGAKDTELAAQLETFRASVLASLA